MAKKKYQITAEVRFTIEAQSDNDAKIAAISALAEAAEAMEGVRITPNPALRFHGSEVTYMTEEPMGREVPLIFS